MLKKEHVCSLPLPVLVTIIKHFSQFYTSAILTTIETSGNLDSFQRLALTILTDVAIVSVGTATATSQFITNAIVVT